MSGLKRNVLVLCDKVIGRLNTRCYTDSMSQKDFLVEMGVIDHSRLHVLGEGSLAGVDLERFSSTRYSVEDRYKLKNELNIPDESYILLFVGRITLEKGVKELLHAFDNVLSQDLDVHLVFVGPFENDGGECLNLINNSSVKENIRIVGFSKEPEKYMSIADVLCLPSYREGFGTVVIEAAAMGVPTVGSDIYGLSDAVMNSETGILVPVRDHCALGAALVRIINDDDLRANMSAKARRRAVEYFGSEYLGRLLVAEYDNLMSNL